MLKYCLFIIIIAINSYVSSFFFFFFTILQNFMHYITTNYITSTLTYLLIKINRSKQTTYGNDRVSIVSAVSSNSGSACTCGIDIHRGAGIGCGICGERLTYIFFNMIKTTITANMQNAQKMHTIV